MEVFVLIVFCFVLKDEGIDPIHLFVFSFFPLTEPGMYPKKKLKTVSCERNGGKSQNTAFRLQYCQTHKHLPEMLCCYFEIQLQITEV